jgi:PilZ domain
MGRLVNDRRRHERFALRLVVQLSATEELAAARCYTQNISSGGFYFLSPEPLIRGEQREIFLALPAFDSTSGSNAGIACQARVVRIDPRPDSGGFGIACEIERYTVTAREGMDLFWRIYA